jgi:hypothetical protein
MTSQPFETVIGEYYRCFNERRFADAARLLADHAAVEYLPAPTRDPDGRAAYVAFTSAWLSAFPDAVLTVDRIDQRGDTLFDVHLMSAGTHRGQLDLGTFRFRPSGQRATLRLRELLDIRQGQIHSASLSFDLNHLITQLSIVDYSALWPRLERLAELIDDLRLAGGDRARQHDVTERLGVELDAARRVLRPHYKG